MICVPYIVNGNYKVAQLSATTSPKPCYIIEKQQGNNVVKLFSFEPSRFAFNPTQGFGANGENDFTFVADSDGSSVSINAANHTANITVALKMLPIRRDNNGRIIPTVQNFEPKDGLSVKGGDVFYDFQAINQQFSDILVINVRLLGLFEPTQNIYYDFSVNVAPRSKTYDIVIDFGSEASQIWINRRDNDPANEGNMMSLFKSIKRNSVYKANPDEKVYQFDPSNPRLFRSLFFVKSEIPLATIQQDDLTFINLEDDLADILSKNVALPNMKLMDHSNVHLPEFYVNDEPINIYQRVNEIRAEILKFFFRTALRQIDRVNGSPVACKITFLVPNTYKQDTLSNVHTQLIEDLRELREDHEQPFTNIKGDIEVATFSESDASFFGWYRAGDYALNDAQSRVLIIDVGKGTTDFSVLRISSSQGQVTVERMARSGFVGAGNVMTFDLLASIIRQIAYKIGETKVANIYDAIRNMAYHPDRALKNKLYRELEKLKCAQHIQGRKSIAGFIDDYSFDRLNSIGELTIEKLSDMLNEANRQECFQQSNDTVVNCYAKQIADLLIRELRYVYDDNIHVDRVVLSGRGAMSQPLADAIRDAFHTISDQIEVTQLPPAVTKSGCLKGPLNRSLHLDHMNMNIVGWPQQKRNLAMRASTPANPQPEAAGENRRRRRCGFLNRLRDIFNPDEQVELNNPVAANDGFNQDALAREFLRDLDPQVQSKKWERAQGTQYNIEANTNLFVIGNRRCTVDFVSANARLGLKNMFFDGNDFVLRDVNTSVRFTYDPVAEDEGFITETFFPMTELNGNVAVNIPKLSNVLTACSNVVDADDMDDLGDDETQMATPHTVAASATVASEITSALTTSTTFDDDDLADDEEE